MRVTTGTVVNGKIEIPGETFAEGTTVTILAREAHVSFTLGPEADAALLKATEEMKNQQSTPKGTPGRELLKFFGTIDSEDCRRMEEAIEAGCERVDPRGW